MFHFEERRRRLEDDEQMASVPRPENSSMLAKKDQPRIATSREGIFAKVAELR